MLLKKLVILGALLLSNLAFSHNLALNSKPVAVTNLQLGELSLSQNKINYQAWNSQDLVGKVRIVNHLAARNSAKKLSEPLVKAIKQANFPRERYQTTTIVNINDATLGMSSIAKGKVEEGKKENPHSQVIIDRDGVLKEKWQLKPETSMVMVLDKQGNIRFVKEGALSNAEVAQIITLVNDLLK